MKFDHIVVGGGTAGLVLANRLSENSSKSVLVLETGNAHFDDPAVYLPTNYGKVFGNMNYDWGFETIPQQFSDNVKYYWPRPNLKVLVGAPVTKVLSENVSGLLIATGAEFSVDGKSYTTWATDEVILSAGAIKTPQILELSGIGDSKILAKLGIDVKLDLPTVGTNVQDHLLCGTSYEIKEPEKFNTYDPLFDPVQVAEHMKLHAEGKGQGLYALGLVGVHINSLAMVSNNAKEIQSLAPTSTTIPGLAEQYAIQNKLTTEGGAELELVSLPGFYSFPKPPSPGKKYITLAVTLNKPYSRGTIHAASTDPLAHPEMDPHYFEEKVDLEKFVEQVKFARRVAKTEPFASIVEHELNPGPDISDDDLTPWVKKTLTTVHHVIGSTSMLPRDGGGVVGPGLGVCGGEDLRVVDLGVVPLRICAHPQSAVYAIAEQAADIIKGTF